MEWLDDKIAFCDSERTWPTGKGKLGKDRHVCRVCSCSGIKPGVKGKNSSQKWVRPPTDMPLLHLPVLGSEHFEQEQRRNNGEWWCGRCASLYSELSLRVLNASAWRHDRHDPTDVAFVDWLGRNGGSPAASATSKQCGNRRGRFSLPKGDRLFL